MEGGKAVCDLCCRNCRIDDGCAGACGVRRFSQGIMEAHTYGKVSSLAVDPVEKKPFYHYRPGTGIFSVGSVGCNLHCTFCQNYAISQSSAGSKRTTYKTPEELVGLCRSQKLDQIAFTYNEPTLWLEYIEDVADTDRELGIALVTNGMMSRDAARSMCGLARAMNIDVKSFRQGFYDSLCGGSLADVRRNCEDIYAEGVHLELTYLVIPGHNDDPDTLRDFCAWVRDQLSENVPVHFTRFHPDYRMTDVPITPEDTLDMCLRTAENNGLNYAYVGNILSDEGTDSYCPECGAVLVKRTGYSIECVGLRGNRCACCKSKVNFAYRTRRPASRRR